MLKFNPTVRAKFYVKKNTYVPGQGQTETWDCIGMLYSEWRGSFGNRAMDAQALGVNDSATLRTYYQPTIYKNLRTERVVVIKDADSNGIKNGDPDKNNPNVYELWGGVDNIREEYQLMEFRVRRYEGL